MRLMALYFVVFLERIFAASSRESVVYPRILESRSVNGRSLLHIEQGLVLELEKASILGNKFVYVENVDGRDRHTQVEGRTLEETLLQDAKQLASLSVENGRDGLEVVSVKYTVVKQAQV